MKLTEMSSKPTSKKINKVMESRFGFAVDYDSLTLKKAYTLAKGLSESLDAIKRTHSAHVAEKNEKYMEMLMVREGLHRWMAENQQRFITESEMAKSEAILAAKDVVDTLQDMLEKVSKLQNEQMPALVDTIRDQIGTEQAEQFKGTIGPVLSQLYDALGSGREQADTAARTLAGEQVDQPMGLGGAEPSAVDAVNAELPSSDLDSDEGDGFDATDAAAGGDEALGRERR